jgi:hypothetical protein
MHARVAPLSALVATHWPRPTRGSLPPTRRFHPLHPGGTGDLENQNPKQTSEDRATASCDRDEDKRPQLRGAVTSARSRAAGDEQIDQTPAQTRRRARNHAIRGCALPGAERTAGSARRVCQKRHATGQSGPQEGVRKGARTARNRRTGDSTCNCARDGKRYCGPTPRRGVRIAILRHASS